jgi:hypothetical protein
MPAARAKDVLGSRCAPLAVPNEFAATGELLSKAWTRGGLSLRGEHQRRVRSWGLRRKREDMWRQCLMGDLNAGPVCIGVAS